MTIVIKVNAYKNDVFVMQKCSFNDSDTPLLLSVTTGNIDALNEVLEREPDKKVRERALKDLSNFNEAIIAYSI